MRRVLRSRVSRSAVVSAAALAIAGTTAHAQSQMATGPVRPTTAMAPKNDPSRRGVDPRPARGGREGGTGATVVLARAVVVRAAPRGYHVVNVPVPAELIDQTARYTVEPSGVVPILGKLSGTLVIGARERAVTLTVGVPSDARAGASSVGSVVFSAARGPAVEVPITLEVAPTRRVELSINESLRGVRPGERFPISYQLLNLGNASDTITVRMGVPTGWRVEGGDGMTALAPGVAVTRTIHVTAPRDVNRGSLSMRLTAYAQGRAVASADAVVELVGADGRAASVAEGTTLRVGATGVRGVSDGTPVGLSYSLDGNVTETIKVSARATSMPNGGTTEGMALSRFGVSQTPPSLTLSAPTWRFSAGAVGGQLTDLTGTAAGGEGASFALERSQWGASVVAARPNDGAIRYGTDVLFGQLSRKVGSARFTTSVSSLREALGPTGVTRSLDAISGGLSFGSSFERRLSSELAYRKFDAGAGLGAATSVSLRDDRGSIEARVAHSAGGSQAFARATNEFTASANRQLTSWATINASGWQLGGAVASARSLRTNGWTIAGNARVSSTTSLTLGARRSGYSSEAAGGSFGSADQAAFGAVQLHAGSVGAAFDATLGARSRTMQGTDAAITDRTLISRYASTLNYSASVGTLGLTGAIADNGVGAGYPGRQVEYGAQADGIPLVSIGRARVVAGGSAQRTTSFVTPGSWITTIRGGVGAQLPFGMSVALDAEKNPLYFVGTYGAGPGPAARWVYALRVERALRLPQFGKAGGVDGRVFSDVNGDGRYSAAEPGLAGIVVRRGGEMVVTGRDGKYRFIGTSHDAVTVDVRSLPIGWITPHAEAMATGDIPVVSVSAVDIRLWNDAADSTRVTEADLAKTIVVARDTTGRVWVARMLPNGVARFDALPPGRYTTSIDFSQAKEPLRVAQAMPSFSTGVGPVAPMPLQVIPRPLRFQVGRKPAADSTHGASDVGVDQRQKATGTQSDRTEKKQRDDDRE